MTLWSKYHTQLKQCKLLSLYGNPCVCLFAIEGWAAELENIYIFLLSCLPHSLNCIPEQLQTYQMYHLSLVLNINYTSKLHSSLHLLYIGLKNKYGYFYAPAAIISAYVIASANKLSIAIAFYARWQFLYRNLIDALIDATKLEYVYDSYGMWVILYLQRDYFVAPVFTDYIAYSHSCGTKSMLSAIN